MFSKFGELSSIGHSNIQQSDSVLSDPAIEERFRKFAGELRRIAPKADDFLYFSAIMLHAAEASLINADGSPKLKSNGEPIQANWEISKNGSWKWVCNDPSIRPYKNSNGDIFPESELLKAHRAWVEKPLCVDHKSNQVDAIRGVILDTYYDRAHKRVIGLCALDKVSYPELARGVATGYKTCVSMGTGVSQAICYDCGNVARTEHDFCSHMRSKSCYGEINVGLQPIELSIVVNGADPQAKIRTILAAANTLNSRLSQNEETLQKLSISSNLDEDQLSKLKELENDLKNAGAKLAEFKALLEETGAPDAPYGVTSGQYTSPEDEVNQNATTLNLPQRLASNNDALVSELQNLKSSMEGRLLKMEQFLQNLHKTEETMSNGDSMNKEAYFQGPGGVNEPTPGKKKYPVDPLNEKLRSEDKHMQGQPPFPGVGDADGMHPSPSSVSEKDEEKRKELLSRAEEEERKLRRAAALQKAKENIMSTKKDAYWNGGGGVNEPTPGKQKYKVDPLNEKDRDKEDKQMVGEKPFPGVGNVEDLYPGDMEKKKLLHRASLKARFVRVANPDGTLNKNASAWNVFSADEAGNEKIHLTASVDEISAGRTEQLFDTIATKEFGKKLLEKVYAVGIDQATKLYKDAQANAGMGANPGVQDMGGAGAAPAGAGAAAPAMPDLSAPADNDKGAKGDPKETALKLAEEVNDKASDLLEAVRSLTGEQPEMGEMDQSLTEMPKAAASQLAPLVKMRKQLNEALISGMKKSLAELKEHKEELELIATVVDSQEGNDYVNTVVEDAFNDAKKAIADAHSLMRAFVKYARGTAGLAKRAEEAEMGLFALAEEDENDARKKAKKKDEDSKSKKEDKKDEKKSSKEEDDNSAEDSCSEDENSADSSSEDESDESCADDDVNDVDIFADDDGESHPHAEDLLGHVGDDDGDFEDEDEDMPELEPERELDFGDAMDDNAHFDTGADLAPAANDSLLDSNAAMVDVPAGTPATALPAGTKMPTHQDKIDLTTKAGRAAYRAKLAADATGKQEDGELKAAESIGHSDMLDEAHKHIDGQTKLDTKPSGDLGKVETKVEQHKKVLEIARSAPKVRKEAERLNQLIVEGKVNVSELDSLIAQGLDAEVVKYWRDLYGEAGKEGSEFAKLLTTETFKSKMAEEMSTYRVKLGRAYEMAYDMVRNGLCNDERTAVTAMVDDIMQWNDASFDSMKRMIAKHAASPLHKQASVPQVGIVNQEMFSKEASELDLAGELDRAFSNRRY